MKLPPIETGLAKTEHKAKAAEATARVTKKLRKAKAKPAKQKALPKPVRSAPQAGQPPSLDELQALVSELGLAGTVQEIMGQTGWDFKKAAHYLAQARKRMR